MKKGKNEIGLTILMPFSISPSMSVSPVANNWLCSCFIVQAVPAAGSIWAVREQIGTNSGVISFFLFDKSSCSHEHVGLETRKLLCILAAVLLQHHKLPQIALLTPKLPEGWKDSFNINALRHSANCTSSIIMPLKKLPQDCCMKLP